MNWSSDEPSPKKRSPKTHDRRKTNFCLGSDEVQYQTVAQSMAEKLKDPKDPLKASEHQASAHQASAHQVFIRCRPWN